MAKTKTNKEAEVEDEKEVFELGEKGVVTVKDLLRAKRGVNQVRHAPDNPEEMQKLLGEQQELLDAQGEELDAQDEKILSLEERITELEEAAKASADAAKAEKDDGK